MTAKKTATSTLGLESIGNLSDLLNQPESAAKDTGPLILPLDLIDEDPHQPRTKYNPGFLLESLKELAATIKTRGVKTPISVRESQVESGRFIINHGARRVRASMIAGMKSIPAFIDNDYNEADQVIENLQRNELTAREIADYIGRELAKGVKKGKIASSIGKSAAFVSQHVTLLDLPEVIADAFNSGRVNDVTVINELVKVYKQHADEVVTWLQDDAQELTRASVKLLREYLDDKNVHDERDPNTVDAFTGRTDTESDKDKEDQLTATNDKNNKSSLDSFKKAIVQVKYNDRPARLILNRRPSAKGWAWLKYDDSGDEIEVDLAKAQLVALIEG